jgi:hypothetical protein
MTSTLRSDQHTYIGCGCPIRSDLHPADDLVEVILGEHRFGDDTLRLVVDAPDTLLRLAETLREAHSRLTHHLETATHIDPAMPQVDHLPAVSDADPRLNR